jgi:hypothetical protein
MAFRVVRKNRRPVGPVALVSIRTLYESQTFNFVGPYDDNGLLEDYTAQVRGQPLSCVVLVKSNVAWQAQHIVTNYRPRTALLSQSRRIGERLSDSPYSTYFVASASCVWILARWSPRLIRRPHRTNSALQVCGPVTATGKPRGGQE